MWAFFLSKDNNFEKDPIALSGLHNFHNDYGLKTTVFVCPNQRRKISGFCKGRCRLINDKATSNRKLVFWENCLRKKRVVGMGRKPRSPRGALEFPYVEKKNEVCGLS